jgi:ribosomal protein S27AE
MKDLKQQFQEETKLSFIDIPINGVHLEYINWLEKRIEALSIADVKDLCCASCGYQMKFNKNEDKWICNKCGHTSQHYR